MRHAPAHQPELIVTTIRPGLHITQSCFRVGARHFEFSDLRDLQTRHAAHDPLTRNCAMLALGGLLVLLLFAGYLRPAGFVAISAILLGLVAAALVSSRLRPRRLELWALHRGRPAQLFVTDDTWLFNAVERHLRKALTEHRFGYVPLPPRRTPRSAVPHPSMVHPSRMRTSYMT